MAVNMSKKDEDALAAASEAWFAANAAGDTAGMEKAHADAEAIRASYGYSGGEDGSEYIPTASKNTYTPLDNSGNDYASMVGMSDLHKAALEAASQSWSEATTDEGREAAHAQAEAIRALYGYSGGADGSQYLPNAKPQVNTGFSYDSAPSYTDKYSPQIEELLGKILNRDSFSYDAANDPLYQQYSQQYLREGKRAMKDTLGQVSARTGGLASSYATTAAQQANDYYAAQVADKIPELYQLAYSMYLDDIDGQVRDLGLLQDMSDTQYDRYLDTMNDWRDDRNFAYQMYQDDVAKGQYEDETSWNRGSYTIETEHNQALQKAETLAAAGDFSGYKALGYTDTEIASLKAAYDAAQTLVNKGGNVSTSGDDTSGTADWDGLFAAAKQSGHPQSFISNNYKQFGFTSSSGLWNDYQEWEGSAGEEIQGKDGLGEQAQRLYQQLYSIPGLTQDNKVAMVQRAWENKKITDAESNFLLKYLGYDQED